MKNAPRQFCPLSLDATKRSSLSSMLSGAVRVAMGFLCICFANAFAGDGSNESAPPPSPPPSNAVPSDPEAQLTPEQGKEYYDRFITGDWGGFRTQLHNWGIDFSLGEY